MVFLAEDVAGRNAAFVEEQLCCIGSKVANLLQLLAHGKALGPGWEQHKRNTLVAFRAGAHCQNDVVRAGAVGDPQLLAGDDQNIAFGAGASCDSRHVRAACGLAYAKRADPVATYSRWKEFLFLLIRAK